MLGVAIRRDVVQSLSMQTICLDIRVTLRDMLMQYKAFIISVKIHYYDIVSKPMLSNASLVMQGVEHKSSVHQQ